LFKSHKPVQTRHQSIESSFSSAVTSTVSQSFIQTTQASFSDKINRTVAIPATAAGIVAVGLSAYALKLQNDGKKCQGEQISAIERSNLTLRKIEDLLSSMAVVGPAGRVSTRREGPDSSEDYDDNGEDNPPPSAPQSSLGPAQFIPDLSSTTDSSVNTSGSLIGSPFQDDDTQSRYTSEEHVSEVRI
jgi:hypothetical protein